MRVTVLTLRRAGYPQQESEAIRQFCQRVCHPSIARIWSSVRIGDVVPPQRSDHVFALAAFVHLLEPLPDGPSPLAKTDALPASHEFAQRERARPHVGISQHDLAEMLATHGHHHIRG